jgi:hypothetical protein
MARSRDRRFLPINGEMSSIPRWTVQSAALIIAGVIAAAVSHGRMGAVLLIGGVLIALRATRPQG